MATIVDALKVLYKEIGGKSEFAANATTADIIVALAKKMGLPDIGLIPYSQETIFGHNVADLQTDLVVTDNDISGKLTYTEEGDLPDMWGAGHFFAVEFSDADESLTSIKMGMFPTYKNGKFVYDDSGLSEVVNDPDKGGAWKVTDKNIQSFKIVTSDGDKVHTQVWDLSKLTLLPPANDEE